MILSVYATSCSEIRPYYDVVNFTMLLNYVKSAKQEITNDWESFLKLLELTDITLIFILTIEQPYATRRITSDKFKEYMIHESPPITNPNYLDRPGRLKVYIFKGKGEPYEV